jgi:hypothetical protein
MASTVAVSMLPWVRRAEVAGPIKMGLLEDVSGDLVMFGS